MKNEMKITCLGYKKAFTNEKMWHYKLEEKGFEYLIVDAGMIKLLDMIWTKKNEFENADFSDKKWIIIEDKIKKVNKIKKELGEDEEKQFFTQHKIKPPVVKKKAARKELIFDYNEVNKILDILKEFDCINSFYKTESEITQDMIDYAKENYNEYFVEAFEKLKGYKVSHEKDGSHKNDGQMVEYSFTFKSPAGKITYLTTEMCLMIGWNHHESLKFK